MPRRRSYHALSPPSVSASTIMQCPWSLLSDGAARGRSPVTCANKMQLQEAHAAARSMIAAGLPQQRTRSFQYSMGARPFRAVLQTPMAVARWL